MTALLNEKDVRAARAVQVQIRAVYSIRIVGSVVLVRNCGLDRHACAQPYAFACPLALCCDVGRVAPDSSELKRSSRSRRASSCEI